MTKIIEKYSKAIIFVNILLFAFITFIIMLNHQPWSDEANAWLIAKWFNFINLIKIEHYDGHFFLWHSILMPLAKNNLFYPMSMYILNWIFCVLAIIVLNTKSPFSLLQKFLITFSCPFVYYWASVGRCYGLAIFILFIILSMWKDRLKYPVIIPVLLLLFTNTSVLSAIGGITLNILYLFDLQKNKKRCFIPMFVYILCLILIFLQISGAVIHHFGNSDFYQLVLKLKDFLASNKLNIYILVLNNIFAVSFGILILLSIKVFYKNNKYSLIFLLSTYFSLILLFSIGYTGHWWHYLFFYLYLISAIWIAKAENNNFTRFYNSIFILTILIMFLKTAVFNYDYYDYVYSSNSKNNINFIKDNKLISRNDKLYFYKNSDHISIPIAAYLNMPLYDTYGNNRYSLNGYKLNLEKFDIDTDLIIKSLDNTKRNILISSTKDIIIIPSEKYELLLTPISDENYIYIYEISYKNVQH